MLYDPFLLNDMDKLVDRIIKAKDNNEKICIYGDYDVDGITSITVIYSFLKELGVDVTYYLPGRMEEGYGLNKEALDKLKEDNVKLCITVDCGISAHEQAEYAKKIGLDLCITDHHECTTDLPLAIAVVNPKRLDSTYPFAYLAGVGVAFKVIMGLATKLNMEKETYLKYLDIVTVGTIADIVELKDENRVIAYNGIGAINETKNKGLKELIKVSGINKVDSSSISFTLAPRINASGRMADAGVAVKLLLSETEVEAAEYAKVLDNQNRLRQEVEKGIYEQAVSSIEKNSLDKKKTIVLAKENWHQGVIGIVASKLVEKYLKPVILFVIDQDGMAKGSGRTPQGLSLYNALSECSDILESFGGHELAAGLTINMNNLEQFKERFEEAVSRLKKEEFLNIIDIDTEIKKTDLNIKLIRDIAGLAPFGQKNNIPVFEYKNLKVVGICTLKDGKHLKLLLQDDGSVIEGLAFSQGDRRDDIKIGDKVDIACQVTVNEFMNQKKIQFLIIDFKKRT
jgi:single-stranded-DNA-specific exonuclease